MPKQVAGDWMFVDCFGISSIEDDFNCSEEVFNERYKSVQGLVKSVRTPLFKKRAKECLKRMDAAREKRNEEKVYSNDRS